jgi:hypothetical protein
VPKIHQGGHPIAACTVWQILHDAGIAPPPRCTGPTWKQFLTAQAHRPLESRPDFASAQVAQRPGADELENRIQQPS